MVDYSNTSQLLSKNAWIRRVERQFHYKYGQQELPELNISVTHLQNLSISNVEYHSWPISVIFGALIDGQHHLLYFIIWLKALKNGITFFNMTPQLHKLILSLGTPSSKRITHRRIITLSSLPILSLQRSIMQLTQWGSNLKIKSSHWNILLEHQASSW